MRRLSVLRSLRVAVLLAAAPIALTLSFVPNAWAAGSAGTVDSPSNGTTIALDAKGDPAPVDVVTSGFAKGTSVFLMICDGKAPTAADYNPSDDCDITTAPPQVVSTGPSDHERFTTANSHRSIVPFRGAGGSGTFNCLSPADTKRGAKPKPHMGDVVPASARTANGNPIDLGLPSWDDCQIRASSNNTQLTADQTYVTFRLPGEAVTSGSSSSSVPLAAVISPIGVAVLIAGGVVITRRRRTRVV